LIGKRCERWQKLHLILEILLRVVVNMCPLG